MKHSPITRAFRATVALVAVTAWFHASNHLAIGEMLPKPAPSSDHASCHGQEDPGDEDEGGTCVDLSCCSSLSALPLSLATGISYDFACYTEVDYLGNAAFPFLAPHDMPIAELDTGPPERDSFAEAVLQRSLLAHAPPLS